MRYGGDEFVCVVPDLDIRKLHQLEQNIQHALAELSSASHFSFPIEASIGSVIADDPVFSLNDYINLADQKMYQTKKSPQSSTRSNTMTPYITRALAQQIVDTVRDLCGQNVNFIDCSGTIFASTDAARIGTFHEIGQQAAERGTVIEVRENDRFTGTQQGVNLPVYHNHKMIAVIGITGNPDEVRKYAKLAERITRLLIREKELDAFNRTESDKKAISCAG